MHGFTPNHHEGSIRSAAAIRAGLKGGQAMARDLIPSGYDDFLRELKERIRQARVRAALAVNRELVLLY